MCNLANMLRKLVANKNSQLNLILLEKIQLSCVCNTVYHPQVG